MRDAVRTTAFDRAEQLRRSYLDERF